METTQDSQATVRQWLEKMQSQTTSETTVAMADTTKAAMRRWHDVLRARTEGESPKTTAEWNKALVRRWLDLANANQVKELCLLTSPKWRLHGAAPDMPDGPAGIRALFNIFGKLSQFLTIEDMIAEDDRVAVRVTIRSLQNNYFGIAGHERWQSAAANLIFRIEGGQVSEIWRNSSEIGLGWN